MGRSHRSRPLKLGKKLKQIRIGLKLSQAQMVKTLDLDKEAVYPASISLYEQGQREPPLLVLLRYAEVANVCLDVLADDKQPMPRQFACREKTLIGYHNTIASPLPTKATA
jgi:transcriptional regulator with XRE-family HTH domain